MMMQDRPVTVNQADIGRERNRACESCSKKKRKCNGWKPKCSLCLTAGTNCVYPAYSLKPGPKRGSKRGQRFAAKRAAGLAPINSRAPAEHAAEDDDQGRQNPILGSSSSLKGDPTHLSAQAAAHQPSESSPRRTRPQHGSGISAGNQRSVLPPQALVEYLVATYFDFIHPQLRLFHQPSFVDWVRTGNWESSDDAILLLCAVSALAARHTTLPEVELFDRSLCYDDDAESSSERSPPSPKNRNEEWDRGLGFLHQSRILLQRATSKLEKAELASGKLQLPSLRLVQAAILVAFAEVQLGASGRAFSLIATSVRLAQDLGLDAVDKCRLTKPNSNNTRQLIPCGIVGNVAAVDEDDFVAREELRRAWWAVAELENFICTSKSRARMIAWESGATMLPCDDEDWFSGRARASMFLPPTLPALQDAAHLAASLSIMACRVVGLHLIATAVNLVAKPDATDGDALMARLVQIEQCAAAWRDAIPQTVAACQALHLGGAGSSLPTDPVPCCLLLESVLLLSSKARFFQVATPWQFLQNCHDGFFDTAGARDLGHKSHESEAFTEILRAADAIYSLVRDWPARCILQSCPFLVGSLWAPASIQLLAKCFAASGSPLADKAALSLTILIAAMEQFAEKCNLGRHSLELFRIYERKLTQAQCSETEHSEANEGSWEHGIVTEVLCFPRYVDFSFLQAQMQPAHPVSYEIDPLANPWLHQEMVNEYGDGNMFPVPNGILLPGDPKVYDHNVDDLSWMVMNGMLQDPFLR